jgi:hypothetical protein
MDATIWTKCTGPNPACRAAHRAGRSVHIIPPMGTNAPVMGTYHYATEAEARAALVNATANAPMVDNDDDLARYTKAKVSYRLPVGWIHPDYRRGTCPGTPHRGHTTPGGACPAWNA